MTIPLLTAHLSEPARSSAMSGKPCPEPRTDAPTDRKDDRDFAAAMSQGTEEAAKHASETAEAQRPAERMSGDADRKPGYRTSTEHADEMSGKGATEGDEEISAMVVPETPRRQVTIPDLPARRATTPIPAARAPDAAPTIKVTDSDALLAAPAPDTARPDHPAATAEAQVNAAPRAGLATAMPGQEASRANPAMVQPASADADAIAGLESVQKASEAGQRHGAFPAQPDAHLAAPNNPVAQMVRANTPRGAVPGHVEDRKDARTRDPLTRAMDALAATPAPTSQTNTPQTSTPQAALAAQVAILQPGVRDATGTKDKTETLLSLDGEAEESLRFDLRGSTGPTGTQQGSFAAAMTRADLPRHVALQIADVARAMPDRPVDVSLSPEELGRVRLSISTSEGGVTLHVLAERPETLDLMRRHADQLARELADLGFTSIDLAFGKGRDPERGDGDGASGKSGGRGSATDLADAVPPPDGPANRLTLGPTGGLDIRI